MTERNAPWVQSVISQILAFHGAAPKVERELDALTEPLLNAGDSVEVTDAESCAAAKALFLDVKAARKKVAGLFEEVCANAKGLLDHWRGKRKRFDDPLASLEESLESKILKWEEAQEAERRRLEIELSKEARAQQEALIMEEAEALSAMGRHEEADMVIEQMSAVPPVVIVPSPAPKVAGTFAQEHYSADVNCSLHAANSPAKFEYDCQACAGKLVLLAAAVAEGVVPLRAIAPNGTFLNAQARAAKRSLSYPGVTVRSRKNYAGRVS